MHPCMTVPLARKLLFGVFLLVGRYRSKLCTLSTVHGSQFEQLLVSRVQQECEELLSVLLLTVLGSLLDTPAQLLRHCQLLPCMPCQVSKMYIQDFSKQALSAVGLHITLNR